jgi:predicted alpha-1,6-mannanase (GH76 family)
VDGNPLFGHQWRLPARMPRTGGGVGGTHNGSVDSSTVPERDLSVQLSGWMLMEAAHRLSAAGF